VMAGDVYTHAPYVGRGGWSWYTGSAAWMHRAAIESIFGLQQDAHSLCFQPCLPTHWPRAELLLRREALEMRFILVRAPADTALASAGHADARLLLPGEALPWNTLAGPSCYVIPLGASHDNT